MTERTPSHGRRAFMLTLALGCTAIALPAAAGSQSSNSSSNCSNERCTRTDSLVIEDRRGVRGFTRTETWEEGRRAARRRQRRGGSPYDGRRRNRDDDDDDDD